MYRRSSLFAWDFLKIRSRKQSAFRMPVKVGALSAGHRGL
jgi:hypothetical protein